MPRFTFDKLVRDKIIDDQVASGGVPDYYVLSKVEHIRALIEKITEEAHEIADAPADEYASEIADVQQALDDLMEKLDVDKSDVQQAQRKKFEKVGGFKKGIYIRSVELRDDDKWVAYHRSHPDKYPEIS